MLETMLGTIRATRWKLGGKESTLVLDTPPPILGSHCVEIANVAYGGCKLVTNQGPLLADLLMEHGRASWMQFSRPIPTLTAVQPVDARVYTEADYSLTVASREIIDRFPSEVRTMLMSIDGEIQCSPPASEESLKDMEWRLGRALPPRLKETLLVSARMTFEGLEVFGPLFYRTMDPATGYFVLTAPLYREVELDFIEFEEERGLVIVDQLEEQRVEFGDDFAAALKHLVSKVRQHATSE